MANKKFLELIGTAEEVTSNDLTGGEAIGLGVSAGVDGAIKASEFNLYVTNTLMSWGGTPIAGTQLDSSNGISIFPITLSSKAEGLSYKVFVETPFVNSTWIAMPFMLTDRVIDAGGVNTFRYDRAASGTETHNHGAVWDAITGELITSKYEQISAAVSHITFPVQVTTRFIIVGVVAGIDGGLEIGQTYQGGIGENIDGMGLGVSQAKGTAVAGTFLIKGLPDWTDPNFTLNFAEAYDPSAFPAVGVGAIGYFSGPTFPIMCNMSNIIV